MSLSDQIRSVNIFLDMSFSYRLIKVNIVKFHIRIVKRLKKKSVHWNLAWIKPFPRISFVMSFIITKWLKKYYLLYKLYLLINLKTFVNAFVLSFVMLESVFV
jgi:hypothetical protein